MTDTVGDEMKEIVAAAPDTKIAPAQGIAAIALSMAMKFHGMMMIPDGLTYQQYKMEGRNIREIGLTDVFETAINIERHLLASETRIADLIVSALEIAVDDEPEEPSTSSSPPGEKP